MIVSNNPITGRIRSETAALHQELENSAALKCLLSPQVSLKDYQRYVQLSAVYHRLVETYSFPVISPLISDLSERIKMPHIARDLASSSFPLSTPTLKNELHPVSFHLGMVYVSEGSTLGGTVLHKHVSAQLGTEHRFHLLNCYEDQAGSMWRKFTQQLCRYADTCSPEEQNQIVAGALHGFRINLRIFN